MNPITKRLILAAALTALSPAAAHAGMPSITLTDVARMRIENISFFLLGFLVSAAAIQFLWNRLRNDFTILPRLTYGKALGVVTLWGLLFVLVLTMISGARELMTPGAWEKQGKTYRLAKKEVAAAAVDERLEKDRKESLDRLRVALWEYAGSHEKHFPADRASSKIANPTWRVPDPAAVDYVYVGGLTADKGAAPLAYEPEIYESKRFVLLTNGEIRRMDSEKILEGLVVTKPK